jgi:hypothetical protein
MEAVDPARRDEAQGLMGKEEDPEEGRGGPSRWRGRLGEEEDWSEESRSEDGRSTMSVGVSKVKAAQAVW